MSESIADIVAEMRECANAADPSILGDERIAELVRNTKAEQLKYADRIGAAAKREKPAISEDCKRSKYERLHECFWEKRAVQCVIRQMLDERDDLSSIDSVAANRMDYFANLLIDAASDDGKSLVNVAKIREAMEDIVHSIEGKCAAAPTQVTPTEYAILHRCKAALTAPPELIGNNAKIYEALAAYLALWDNGTMNNLDKLKRVIKQMREALAEPPRNCDVGTAKEQHERHLKFCDEHARYMRCSQCPAGSNNIVTCHFTWMQMPYEEGGAS